jgi:antitoxin FitA
MPQRQRLGDAAPFWCYIGGMASLTLKNIPPRLHEQLRERAARHRRSLSQEALACLEQAAASERLDPNELLAKARR